MRPTRLRTLLVCAVLAAVAGYLVGEYAYGDLPPLPRYGPITLVLLAIVELAIARVVRDRVAQRARRGARALHPLQVARAVALAKASSPAAALLLGGYVGLLASLAPSDAAQARSDVVVCAISSLSALLLVVAALVLERACRTPETPDDARGLGSRA